MEGDWKRNGKPEPQGGGSNGNAASRQTTPSSETTLSRFQDKHNKFLTFKNSNNMAQPYYVRKTELRIGERKGETVYGAQAYYYGTITTKQVATQIAQESALTQADVIGVIERISYFCQTHMALGYKVKIDGMGTFYNQLLTTGTAPKTEDVSAKLIRGVRPAFSPEHTLLNGSFRYALLPEKTELVKIEFNAGGTPSGGESGEEPGGSGSDTGAGNDGGGSGGGIEGI